MKTTITIEDLKDYADKRSYEAMQLPEGEERSARLSETAELLAFINQKLGEE